MVGVQSNCVGNFLDGNSFCSGDRSNSKFQKNSDRLLTTKISLLMIYQSTWHHLPS
ncbi:hypothetical protein [Tolypothrix sp. VBCCA 56010]|uniref:hypothetical protein n=1 Tax=Tolypothrix sp. VBCCA 56010 TaxID=3137731 RepID=UPI003D7C7675